MTFNDYKAYRQTMKPILEQKRLLRGNPPEVFDHPPEMSLTKKILFTLGITGLVILGSCSLVHAYTVDQWANAIKKQEGNRWPYGIKQFGHISPFKARIICKRTIWYKWQNYSKLPQQTRQTIDFVDYLADRYCPYSVDPQGNLNWKHNLPIILREGL